MLDERTMAGASAFARLTPDQVDQIFQGVEISVPASTIPTEANALLKSLKLNQFKPVPPDSIEGLVVGAYLSPSSNTLCPPVIPGMPPIVSPTMTAGHNVLDDGLR